MNIDVDKLMDIASKALSFVFSWIVLLGISVIVSGKLLCRNTKISTKSDDLFTINIGVFRITARGDEVLFGFLVFLLALPIVIFLGGKQFYEAFKINAGLDIGQWNSECILASFLSIAASFLVYLFLLTSRGSGILSNSERVSQVQKLRRRDQTDG